MILATHSFLSICLLLFNALYCTHLWFQPVSSSEQGVHGSLYVTLNIMHSLWNCIIDYWVFQSLSLYSRMPPPHFFCTSDTLHLLLTLVCRFLLLGPRPIFLLPPPSPVTYSAFSWLLAIIELVLWFFVPCHILMHLLMVLLELLKYPSVFERLSEKDAVVNI